MPPAKPPANSRSRMTPGRLIFSLGLFAAMCATGLAAALTFRAAIEERSGYRMTDVIKGDSLHP